MKKYYMISFLTTKNVILRKKLIPNSFISFFQLFQYRSYGRSYVSFFGLYGQELLLQQSSLWSKLQFTLLLWKHGIPQLGCAPFISQCPISKFLKCFQAPQGSLLKWHKLRCPNILTILVEIIVVQPILSQKVT